MIGSNKRENYFEYLGMAAVSLCLLFGYIYLHTAQYYNWGLKSYPPASIDTIGARDPLCYWTAWRVGISGGNPYDIESLKKVPFGGTSLDGPSYFLSPPWALIILSPLLAWQFQVTFLLWLALSIIGLLLLPRLLLGKGEVKGLTLFQKIGVPLFFLPSIDAIYFGQLGVYSAVLLTLLYKALKERRWGRSGVFLFLLTIKPHAVYLVIFACFYWAVVERQAKFFLTFFISMVVFSVASIIFFPNIFYNWVGSFQPAYHYNLSNQMATLSSALRQLLISSLGKDFPFLLWLVPVSTLLLVTLILKNGGRYGKPSFALPILIPLSLFTSVYSWGHDYVALLIPTLLIFERKNVAYRNVIYFLFVAILGVNLLGVSGLHQFWWVAPFIALVWYRDQVVFFEAQKKTS